MTETPKLPDMRPQPLREPIHYPIPTAYRETIPYFPESEPTLDTQRAERQRRWRWMGLAVGFHALLLLGLWLAPPLHLKWGPASDAWVHVESLSQAKLPVAPDLDKLPSPGIIFVEPSPERQRAGAAR